MTSPVEMLAIFDSEGRPAGIKPRDEVHRDGDWHQLVFVWCAWLNPLGKGLPGSASLLLQRRARTGDPYASRLDAPAGGHVMASESHLEGARREVGEEVGIELTEEELRYLGESKLELDSTGCSRVMQHFYLCQRAVELEELRFNEEVDGFVIADLEGVIDILDGRRDSLSARARLGSTPGDLSSTITITGAAFAFPEPIVRVIRTSMTAIRSALFRGSRRS